MLADLEVVRPTTLAQAFGLLSLSAQDGEPLRPMAGCTDLMVDAHFGKPMPKRLMDLSGLGKDLKKIEWFPGDNADVGLRLGALCTYAQALAEPILHRDLSLLAQASAVVGATQIQARGTFAGNVENASPAADGVPALMALDAVIVLQSAAGQRRVALDHYYSGYRQTVRRSDELIVAIEIPSQSIGKPGQWWRKVGTRSYQAITKVGLAAVLPRKDGQLSDVRVVAVAMAPSILRCQHVEQFLTARAQAQISLDQLRAEIAKDLKPIDDIRSKATYRAEVFARLLEQALRQTAP